LLCPPPSAGTKRPQSRDGAPGGITPGISGERPPDVHESNAYARVRCMPLLDSVGFSSRLTAAALAVMDCLPRAGWRAASHDRRVGDEARGTYRSSHPMLNLLPLYQRVGILQRKQESNAADNPRAHATSMRAALPASRVHPLVMHAPAAPEHSSAAPGARHRRHNAPIQPRAADATLIMKAALAESRPAIGC
jgi:hypothetical protein